RRVEKLAAVLALVAARSAVAAEGAGAADETVREEAIIVVAIELLDGPALYESPRVEVEEYRLGDLGLTLGGSTPEFIEGDPEPGIDVAVNRMISVAELARGYAFLQRPGLG